MEKILSFFSALKTPIYASKPSIKVTASGKPPLIPPVPKSKWESHLSVWYLEAGRPDHPGTPPPGDGSEGFKGSMCDQLPHVLFHSVHPISLEGHDHLKPTRPITGVLPEWPPQHHLPPPTLPLQAGLWKKILTTHRLGYAPRGPGEQLCSCPSSEHSGKVPLLPLLVVTRCPHCIPLRPEGLRESQKERDSQQQEVAGSR